MKRFLMKFVPLFLVFAIVASLIPHFDSSAATNSGYGYCQYENQTLWTNTSNVAGKLKISNVSKNSVLVVVMWDKNGNVLWASDWTNKQNVTSKKAITFNIGANVKKVTIRDNNYWSAGNASASCYYKFTKSK